MAEISSEDRAAVANEAKARIKGIMTHEEAKGREALAEHLAYDTEMTVEEAAAILKVSPKAEAKKEEAEGDDADESAGGDKKKAKKGGKDYKDDEDEDEMASAPKPKSQFEQAMDNGKHPNVGPDGKGGGGEAVTDNVSRILGAQAAATGRKFEQAKA